MRRRTSGQSKADHFSTQNLANYSHNLLSVLPARRYASADTSHGCLSLSLCLSVTSRSSIETDEWIELVFWPGSFLPPILHRVKRKSSGISKNKDTFLWNFVPISGLRKFCFGLSSVETCYRLSSRKVDAQSVTNWTGVGQLSWQCLRAPTLVHYFITEIIKLCLQYYSVARVN